MRATKNALHAFCQLTAAYIRRIFPPRRTERPKGGTPCSNHSRSPSRANAPAGADLSRVGWHFLHWLLTDEGVNPGIIRPLVRDAVHQCADVLVPLTQGLPVDADAAGAACAARSAAWSAWGAAGAESAAASAAWSAADAAKLSAYVLMADKLIALLETA